MATDSNTWAIDARGLTKTFGTVTAVRGVTLQVPSGTIVLLQSDSRAAAFAIAAIVLLTMVAYYSSLRYAGGSFERRIELLSRRLG